MQHLDSRACSILASSLAEQWQCIQIDVNPADIATRKQKLIIYSAPCSIYCNYTASKVDMLFVIITCTFYASSIRSQQKIINTSFLLRPRLALGCLFPLICSGRLRFKIVHNL